MLRLKFEKRENREGSEQSSGSALGRRLDSRLDPPESKELASYAHTLFLIGWEKKTWKRDFCNDFDQKRTVCKGMRMVSQE